RRHQPRAQKDAASPTVYAGVKARFVVHAASAHSSKQRTDASILLDFELGIDRFLFAGRIAVGRARSVPVSGGCPGTSARRVDDLAAGLVGLVELADRGFQSVDVLPLGLFARFLHGGFQRSAVGVLELVLVLLDQLLDLETGRLGLVAQLGQLPLALVFLG